MSDTNLPEQKIGAIVLGAGLSSRMGRPKLLLPWGTGMVITSVLGSLRAAGVVDIALVTGATHDLLADALQADPVHLAFNPDFADGSMVHSLQTGLRMLASLGMDSALLALGDQPQIQAETVRLVMDAGAAHPGCLVLPSFQMKRGHPWLIPASLWPLIFDLRPDQTMRDFVRSQESDIVYVLVETPSIFADLDTPADYEREKPG